MAAQPVQILEERFLPAAPSVIDLHKLRLVFHSSLHNISKRAGNGVGEG